MIFNEVPEFEREYKKLAKKYRTLDSDLAIFKKVIENIYEFEDLTIRDTFRQKFFDGKRATELTGGNTEPIVIKARLDCAYLDSDVLRVVLIKKNNKITFVEIYNKKDKLREDKHRYKKYMSD